MKRLSILIVAGWFYPDTFGGSDRYIYEVARRLVSLGHDVDVLTSDQCDDFPEYDNIEGINVWRYPVDTGNSVSFYLSTVKNSWKFTRKFLREKDYDIINFNHFLSAFGAYMSSPNRKISRVYTFYAPVAAEFEVRWQHKVNNLSGFRLHFLKLVGCLLKSILRTFEGMILNRCDEIIALSKFSLHQLKRIHNLPVHSVNVIPGGVDVNRFAPAQNRNEIRKKLKIFDNERMLFCVRRLYPRMGLDNLVRSMDILAKEYKRFILIIGGKGPLEIELKNLVKELRLETYVRFEGFIEEDRLPLFYQAADLFVLPTSQLEGFGMVTLESLASGTPVLGTPVGGTSEILEGFDRNFLLADTSPEAIARGITKFMENDVDDDDLRTRCRDHAIENYSWDGIVKEIESTFYCACKIKEQESTCAESAEFGIIKAAIL